MGLTCRPLGLSIKNFVSSLMDGTQNFCVIFGEHINSVLLYNFIVHFRLDGGLVRQTSGLPYVITKNLID